MKLWKTIKRGAQLIREFGQAVGDHELFMNAAASAFFLFLSLPPALLCMVSLVGMIPIEHWSMTTSAHFLDWTRTVLGWAFPVEVANGICMGIEYWIQPFLSGLHDLSTQRVVQHAGEFVDQALPAEVAKPLKGLLENILGKPRKGLLTVSFVTILWSAGGATRSAMRALAAIYEVRARSWFARSLISFALTLGFLLVWSLCFALIPLSNAAAQLVVAYMGLDQGVLLLWSISNWSLATLLVFGSILIFNRFGPDVPMRIQALIPGSLLTLGLWVGMSYGLVRWLEYSWANYNTTYGALAVVIVLLLWCYLLSIGLLLGAELNTLIMRVRFGGPAAGSGGNLRESIRGAVESQIEAIPILEERARKRLPGTDSGAPKR